jgi:glycosyltransferase involved in cell wall biosynthesis
MERSLFIAWKGYQRRVDTIAPKLTSDILFIPHLFKRKLFRPLDYLYKLLVGFKDCLQSRPNFVIVQSPPLYSAIVPWVLGIPYVIDAHNPVFQNVGGKISWGNLPLSDRLIRNSSAVIVHNYRILELAKRKYEDIVFFNIPDPVERISVGQSGRLAKQILVICSFDPDEPIEVLIESMARLPDYTFILTADDLKLPSDLRLRLQALTNVSMTGFLPTRDYQEFLCKSQAALVLTSQDFIQPSGACEALSSDTPLVISNTSLIQELFGSWAILVENSANSIVQGIQQLQASDLDLENERRQWNKSTNQEITNLLELLHRITD